MVFGKNRRHHTTLAPQPSSHADQPEPCPRKCTRLWIFNHYAETPEGSATRTFELARTLAARGHKVTIFACSFSHYRLREERAYSFLQFTTAEEIQGVRFIWTKGVRYARNDWRRIANMISFGVVAVMAGLRDSSSPDVIIGCSVHPLAGLAAMLVSRIKHTRFLVEVPDLWPQVLIDFGRIRGDGLLASALFAIERLFYSRAEKVIMLWRNTSTYIQRRGFKPDRFVWLPHVVDPAGYPLANESEETERTDFTVMYVGSFVQSTALDVLLDAACILLKSEQTQIRLILIGGGVERTRLVERARTMGLSNVEFRGPVAKKHVPEVMRAADCFVCCIKKSPVYQYGVSMNKVCDYLMSGKPIVFSGDSAYDPVAEASAGISVPGEQPDALARALLEVSRLSNAERMGMGRRGIDWANRYHNIDILADRMEQLVAPRGSALEGGC